MRHAAHENFTRLSPDRMRPGYRKIPTIAPTTTSDFGSAKALVLFPSLLFGAVFLWDRNLGDYIMRTSILIMAGLLALTPLSKPVVAETIDVYDHHGGSVAAYNARWSALAARGVSVRVVGPCQSACTVLIGHIPRSKICVTPQASFGFHLAKREDMTQLIKSLYPADIKGWIRAHGGLTVDLKWMRAPDTYRYFRKCK